MKLHCLLVFLINTISSIHLYSQKETVSKKDFCSLHFTDKKSQIECKKNVAIFKEKLFKKKLLNLQNQLNTLKIKLERIQHTRKKLSQKRDDLHEKIKQKLYDNNEEKEEIKNTIFDVREKIKSITTDYHTTENLILLKQEEIEKLINNQDNGRENFSNYNDSSW